MPGTDDLGTQLSTHEGTPPQERWGRDRSRNRHFEHGVWRAVQGPTQGAGWAVREIRCTQMGVCHFIVECVVWRRNFLLFWELQYFSIASLRSDKKNCVRRDWRDRQGLDHQSLNDRLGDWKHPKGKWNYCRVCGQEWHIKIFNLEPSF